MSIYASLQMGLWLIWDGTLTRTLEHLKETATPTVSIPFVLFASAKQISLHLPIPSKTYTMLLINGIGAFALNIVSFQANKIVAPLAVSIAGISKQVLAILAGIIIFRTPMTAVSLLGVVITSIGIAWYTLASLRLVVLLLYVSTIR